MNLIRFVILLWEYRKVVAVAAFLTILLSVLNALWSWRAVFGPAFFIVLGVICFIGARINGELIYYYATLGSAGLAWIAYRLEAPS